MITLHTKAHYPAALTFETAAEAAKAMRGARWIAAYLPLGATGRLKLYLLNPDNWCELHGNNGELHQLMEIHGITWVRT